MGRPRAERNAALVSRVLEDGLTIAAAGEEFGISRQRVQQLLKEHFAVEAALGLEERAFRVRHEQAVALVETLPPEQRLTLLAYVVWPTERLAEASRERARSLDAKALRRDRRRCRRCGIQFAAGYTDGCVTCADRLRSQRRRDRARATLTAAHA